MTSTLERRRPIGILRFALIQSAVCPTRTCPHWDERALSCYEERPSASRQRDWTKATLI